MFGPGLVCDRFQFIQPLPDFVGHRALGPSHVVVDQHEGGEQLWMAVIDGSLVPDAATKSECVARLSPLCAMRHPSLVRTRVVTGDDERVFVGYEVLPGALVLEDIISRYGAMSSTLVLERARSVARGLDALHRRGIVHGGVDGTTVVNWEEQCLLLNYGLFSGLHPDRFRELARRTGSVTVWPPEVIRGEFTPACDVFAWGVLVAQMITGEPPAAAVMELEDHTSKYDIGRDFLDLIRACTHTNPAERPKDATHLVARLEKFDTITRGRIDEVSDALEIPPPPSELESDYTPNFGGASADTDSDEDSMISMTDLALETADPQFDSSPALDVLAGSEEDSAPAKKSPKRAPQPTAKLSALAAEVVGDDGVDALGSVFDGASPGASEATMSSVDLEKLALGAEAAAASDAGLSLIGGGDPTEFDTFATRKQEEDETQREAHEKAIKVDRKKKIKVQRPPRTRRPGPHGPPPNFVSRGVIVVTGALTFLFTLHVATERGGYAKLVDPAFQKDVAESVQTAVSEVQNVANSVIDAPKSPPAVAATGTTDGTGSGTGGTGEGASPTGGDDTTTGEVEQPPQYKPCEEGTVELTDEVCIDEAEYPGLRQIPRVNVSFRDAEAACDERGARLCSIDEWRAACQGPERLRFPYGRMADPEACNTQTAAGYDQDVRRTGTTRGCVTAARVYDLIGNVGEWVSDGRAVGGDSTSPYKSVTCKSAGRPPRGFKNDLLGFRCCVDRLIE